MKKQLQEIDRKNKKCVSFVSFLLKEQRVVKEVKVVK